MNIRRPNPQQIAAAASITLTSDRPERKTWEQLLIGLDDQMLIECYYNAIEMKLEEDFIKLLKKEIIVRGIEDRMLAKVMLQDLQSV